MTEETQKCVHLALLGLKVKDKVTGNKGVVTSICFDLYGCIQAIVSDSKGEGKWYDVSRLEVKSGKPVMDLPDFEAGYIADGKKGGADKPIP